MNHGSLRDYYYPEFDVCPVGYVGALVEQTPESILAITNELLQESTLMGQGTDALLTEEEE